MKNNGKRLLSSVCALALVVNGVAGVMAQDRKGDGQGFAVQSDVEVAASANSRFRETFKALLQEMVNRELGYAGQQGGDSVFQFFSQEMSFDSRRVNGAPFSADIVSETIQVLPDGNRIVQRSEGRIYRDSQGRTRSERTYQMGGSSEQKQVISIRDSVAGASYSLDPETRIARKTPFIFNLPSDTRAADLFLTPPFNPNAPSPYPRGVTVNPTPLAQAGAEAPVQAKKITASGGVLQGTAITRVQPPYPPIAKAAKASGAVDVQITISETGKVIEAAAISGHPLLREPAIQAARQWTFKPTELSGVAVKTQGVLTFIFTLNDEEPAQGPFAKSALKYATNKEQLGKRTIEGVECEGVRAVTTMPAGAIGNERPIETINETWYSPELQMIILSKRGDPRFGESIYQVTNIVRSEPFTALFQIPSDYTIIDSRTRKVELDLKEYEEMRRKIEEANKKTEGAQRPNNQ